MMARDWSDEQNDVIVADYFAMLRDDRAGRSYNKAALTGLYRPKPEGNAARSNTSIKILAQS